MATGDYRNNFYWPYGYAPAVGPQPWKCPECSTWIAWWVPEHKCAFKITGGEVTTGGSTTNAA